MQKVKNPQRLFKELISTLSFMLDLEEHIKLYHAWRVAVLAHALSKRLAPDNAAPIFYTGLLHDVGAFGMQDHIVHHPRLEQQINNPAIREHPKLGAEIVDQIPALNAYSNYVLDHHERSDGLGYPGRKTAGQIGLETQLIRIADTMDIFWREKPRPAKTNIVLRLKGLRNREVSARVIDELLDIFAERVYYDTVSSNMGLVEIFPSVMKNIPAMEVLEEEDFLGGLLRVFAEIIDGRRGYTQGHSRRVCQYAEKIAHALKLPEEEVDKVRWAAFLHDAGKVAMPKKLLDKATVLTDHELKLIRQHPVFTMEILSKITELKEIAQIAGHHHEFYDGSGYPDGLKGKQIPLDSMIIAVSDTFDAITSDRSYQRAHPVQEALAYLKKMSGTRFAPEVVEAALKALR